MVEKELVYQETIGIMASNSRQTPIALTSVYGGNNRHSKEKQKMNKDYLLINL